MGGVAVSGTGHCHWGTLDIEIPPQSRLAFFFEKAIPLPQVTQSGSYCCNFPGEQAEEKAQTWRGKTSVCKCGSRRQGGPTPMPCMSNPSPSQGVLHPDKNSFWSARGFPASLRYKTISDICPI